MNGTGTVMRVMKIIAAAVLAVYLLTASIKDIISKKISSVFLITGIIPVLICIGEELYESANENGFCGIVISHAAGLFIGLIFILISSLTEEKLGKGDALLFCICGAATGYEKVLIIILSAFLLGALYAAAMLATGRLNRKSSFAFAPFIMLGYIMAEVLCSKV